MDWSRSAKVGDGWIPVRGCRAYMRVADRADRQHQRPAIVLVHGIFASSRYMVPLARLLGMHFRVYAPDLLGFGNNRQSGVLPDVNEMGDWLADWQAAMRLGPAFWIGNSLGCQVIARLAAEHPHTAAGVLLTGPTVDPRHRSWLRQGLKMIADAPRERLALIAIASVSALHFGPVRAVKMIRQVLEDRIEDHLLRVRCPALVIRGGRDPLVPQRWAEEATSLLPRGELVVVPGASHALNDSAAEIVAAIATRWIQSKAIAASATPAQREPSPEESALTRRD